MEVPPKLIDFTSSSHAIENIICISRLPLDAQIISSQDLVVIHVTRTLKEVDDPFIEMVAPVGEGVSELGSRFALSVETKGSGQRVSSIEITVQTKLTFLGNTAHSPEEGYGHPGPAPFHRRPS